MAAPDLKKAGLTAASEIAKSVAELTALQAKWRKARDEYSKASDNLRANPPKDPKKLAELDKKLDVLQAKYRDGTLADNKKWQAIHKAADQLIGELPDRIALLRAVQGKFQQVIDKAIPGLKAALKKQAKEREKAIIEGLKAGGIVV